jgi:hypothetical protein
MMRFNKNALAIIAAMSAAAFAGCSGGKSGGAEQPTEVSNAKISVSTNVAIQAQINHITLDISQGATSGSNPAMSDIVVELTKSASTQNQWTGAIGNIPAGAARLFTATAYKNPGTAAADIIYQGSSIVSIQAGATATVTILLQETNVLPGPTRYAPTITSLSVSNSYVLPGTPVTINAAAVDPDGLGTPLTYSVTSTCDAGSGSFSPSTGSGASFSTVFTAPVVNATCQVALLVKETAQASNKSTPLSVTTYFTIISNGNFGKGNVTAFPNSYPIVTVLGDFRYNFFSDVTIMPVGQQGLFQFQATDPDGDNVQFDLTAKCGTANRAVSPPDFSPVAAGSALTTDYFWYIVPNSTVYVGHATNGDGASYRAMGSNGVTPPSPYTAQWNPNFGGATDGFTYSDPTKDCQFYLTVHDLCTNGNCGPAGQGGAADGSFKATVVGGVTITSHTDGVINALAPSKPNRAPVVENYMTVNQDGPAATGVQTWDPQKIAFIDINLPYNLQAAADDRFQNTATNDLSVVWSCNTGSVSTPTNAVGTYASSVGNVPNLTSSAVFTTGPSVPPNAQCTATFTSSNSSLATTVTFKFLKKDPCAINNLANGTTCSSGNACLTGETCLNFVCQGGTTLTCPVNDGQCQNPTCDPAVGCGILNKSNGTSCNKDSNGCTQGDTCQAGACTVGPQVVCNQPADAQCQSASGTCVSTGNSSFTCNYTNLANGTLCNKDNNGCTQNDSCAAGACTAGTAVTCTQTANPCQSASGTCVSSGANTFNCSYTNALNGTGCNVAGTCVAGQTCQAGACQGGSPACQAGQSCTPTTPSATCSPTTVTPFADKDLQVTPPSVVAMGTDGSTYVAGIFGSNVPVSFGTTAAPIDLTSSGGNDIFLAKYDTSGNIAWANLIGDDGGPGTLTDQTATGIAINNGGRLGIIGKITGAVTFGSTTLNTASPTPYIAALNPANGGVSSTADRYWGHSYDLGSNGQFAAVSANPGDASGRYAVCGSASKAGTQLVPGTTYGGGQDLVIGVFDSAGNKLWAVQLGGTGNENCAAIAVDNNGDVYAAGQFDGASLAFCPTGPSSNGVTCTGTPITLAGPNTTARKFMWVAKFAGGTGNTLAAVSYSGSAGAAFPNSIAVNAAGDIAVGGSFSGLLTIGAALANQGGTDAFIAKLHGNDLTPAWNAIAWGGTGNDLVRQLAFTSYGDIVATGVAAPSTSTFKTANGGHDLIGAFGLIVNGATSTDAMIVKVNGTTGASDGGTTYGGTGTETGDSLAVNRFGASSNQIAFTMFWSGNNPVAPIAGTLPAAGGGDSALVFANLQ